MATPTPTPTPTPPTKSVPLPLANNKIIQTMSWCRLDPVSCAREVAIEAAFLAAAYTTLLFISGSKVPPLLKLLKFVLLFVFFSMSGRLLSDSLGDKMAITAVSGLGSKLVSIMAPQFVGW
jgi:hypothetical protein